MDHSYDFLNDVYEKLSILSNFGIYIFMFSITIFGVLTYVFTIKINKPTFDKPKSPRKRNKKEKVSRSKNPKAEPISKLKVDKLESFIKVNVEQNIDVTVPTENEDNNSWIPVQKSKKVPKTEKKPVNIVSEKTEIQLKNPLKVQHNIETIVESQKPLEPKCDFTKTIGEHSVPTLDNEETCVREIETIALEMSVKAEEDVEAEIDQGCSLTLVSESPTNSLAEDFVFIDNYKSSSEDCVLTEGNLCGTVMDDSMISSTSGAGRKKNKKQRKVISKQLIDAAIIEGDLKPVEDSGSFKIATKAATAKKRRPRKDD